MGTHPGKIFKGEQEYVEIRRWTDGNVVHVHKGPSLAGANLRNANLYSANLVGANLEGANLWNADLRNAALWDVNLVQANIQWAIFGATQGIIEVGTPGSRVIGWMKAGVLMVHVGVHLGIPAEEARGIYLDRRDAGEILIALDYLRAIARHRNWVADGICIGGNP